LSNNSVTVLVFKYNMNAMLKIILVSALTLMFGFYLLVYHTDYLWLCLPIVFFILIIRNAERSPFKARIIDENRLIFSTAGIDYGQDHYSAGDIEVVAIYLYAFENFEYRDGFVEGGGETAVYVRAHGDQNKISFRAKGTVWDFDFYLDNYAQFYMVRQVINDWLAEGINVVIKQPFDDDFIIQEMDYYHTPSGFEEKTDKS
jgi:hypothetical protein